MAKKCNEIDERNWKFEYLFVVYSRGRYLILLHVDWFDHVKKFNEQNVGLSSRMRRIEKGQIKCNEIDENNEISNVWSFEERIGMFM